ncbi:hypothetical protein DEJ13_08040 [Curtobacterium sp. MCLR17_007]|uniref:hypothetical protein n=1 Tax=Curtobacterium sp. MCLR17_007 TaxID=2175648 RepID=UPI000DAA4F84|nr:hypothetical protein [Curtobacterium sp. MCLR17_007]WIB61768.1 hypothetical protein DEJ13_08040 [Curtobacterium sp. MCLR17_007]
MKTQSGARTPLVDPFGRELEEWLRDAPATRAPYLSDLVVPPVTGPVQRPDTTHTELTDTAQDELVVPSDTAHDAPSDVELDHPVDSAQDVPSDATSDVAFRRPRDRGRHASTCGPSFPEPPERIALRIEELAVEVSAQSGRPTLERIVVLEDEVRRRDEDLARLTAWEAGIAHLTDPEVDAARAYARSVFADLLADAADEADRRDRVASRRADASRAAAATGTVTLQRPAPAPEFAATPVPVAPTSSDAPVLVLPAVAAPVSVLGAPALDDASADRDEPARLVPSTQTVTPVSANTRPTPLIQPATGPTVIDRDAFAAVLRSHRAETAGTPVVFPVDLTADGERAAAGEVAADSAAADDVAVERAAADQDADRPGWWARAVAAVLRLLGRR